MESPKRESSQEKPLSFADLTNKESVSVSELKATLRDYAESGSAILGDVVIALINRVKLTQDDRKELQDYVFKGIENQEKHPFRSSDRTVAKEIKEYRQVLHRLQY